MAPQPPLFVSWSSGFLRGFQPVTPLGHELSSLSPTPRDLGKVVRSLPLPIDLKFACPGQSDQHGCDFSSFRSRKLS